MNYEIKIKQILKNNGGIVTTSMVRAEKIPTIYLTRMVTKGIIERFRRGIYRTKGGDFDEYYFLSTQYPKIIFSHWSALYLHNFTDKIPESFEISVYSGYNASNMNRNIKVHYIRKSIFELGKSTAYTIFSNKVNVYDMERTICDLIIDRKKRDIEEFANAIQRYSKSKEKNINRLFEYARKMKITKKVRSIMELQL